MIGVSYAADFLSLCVMIHLLWPTRSYLFFNLKHLKAQNLQLDSLEFAGLTSITPVSSMSSLNKGSVNDEVASNASELIATWSIHTQCDCFICRGFRVFSEMTNFILYLLSGASFWFENRGSWVLVWKRRILGPGLKTGELWVLRTQQWRHIAQVWGYHPCIFLFIYTQILFVKGHPFGKCSHLIYPIPKSGGH